MEGGVVAPTCALAHDWRRGMQVRAKGRPISTQITLAARDLIALSRPLLPSPVDPGSWILDLEHGLYRSCPLHSSTTRP